MRSKLSKTEAELRRRHLYQARVVALKEGQPCVDCRRTFHPVAMDFDHRDAATKRFDISHGFRYGWRTVLEEIEKCDLVCANCHRVRGWNRRAEQRRPTPKTCWERQTHCKHGHEFNVANTIVRANGTRKCRACKQLSEKRGYHEKGQHRHPGRHIRRVA